MGFTSNRWCRLGLWNALINQFNLLHLSSGSRRQLWARCVLSASWMRAIWRSELQEGKMSFSKCHLDDSRKFSDGKISIHRIHRKKTRASNVQCVISKWILSQKRLFLKFQMITFVDLHFPNNEVLCHIQSFSFSFKSIGGSKATKKEGKMKQTETVDVSKQNKVISIQISRMKQ